MMEEYSAQSSRKNEFHGPKTINGQDGRHLCEFCEKLRDIDLLYSQPIDLQPSHTALVKSAFAGCAMCEVFMNEWEAKQAQEKDSDNGPDVGDPDVDRITLRGYIEDYLILRQEKERPTGLAYQGNRPFRTQVEIFTSHKDPMASLVKKRPCLKKSDSEASFSLLSRWLGDCKNLHGKCKWQEDLVLPARVIDVGTSSGPTEPFLLMTNGRRGSWATLSHRWGSDLLITTTSKNIQGHQKAIPMDILPPTYRDAITLTRRLGFRYIWIDSLCIIQDSPQDWESELRKMQEIYAGATINIAASATQNIQAGIFSSSNRNRHLKQSLITIPCYSTSQSTEGTISIRTAAKGYPNKPLYKEPLHKRAWVLQESLLSPRRIDFSSSDIYWSCRAVSLSDGTPEVPNSRDPLVTSGRDLFRMPIRKIEPSPPLEPNGIYTKPMSWWYKILDMYMKRSITYQSDVPIAIAGVAKEVAKRSGYHYKAGLWLEDFHRGLLWQSDDNIVRPLSTSAPSWSWISTELPWNSSRLLLDSYEPGYRAEIVELDLATGGNDPFGQVQSSSLKLRGGWRSLDYWQEESIPVYSGVEDRMMLQNQWMLPHIFGANQIAPRGRVLCTVDERLHPASCHLELVRRKVILVQIAKFAHPKSWFTKENVTTIYALMLEPTGREADEYKRIGIAEIPQEDGMADGWGIRTVSIV